MGFELTNGENEIASWEYGVKKRFFFFTVATHKLILTNKRIIALSEGKKWMERDEMQLSDVKGVNVIFKWKRRLLFFKRAMIGLSVYTPSMTNFLFGMSTVRTSFFGRLFGGGRIKVYSQAAQDLATRLPKLLLDATTAKESE